MPLLSIVIPTKNRPDTAVSAVRAACAIVSQDIEIIVQDCSDLPVLGQTLALQVTDARVSYAYDANMRSMTANWNRAIERVRGEYVCIIGDDDGVDARIVEAAAWAKSRGVRALNFPHSGYLWPGHPSRMAGKVVLQPCSGNLSWCDGERELEACMRSPRLPITRLAQTYHGLVHREVYAEMRQQTGVVFDGLAPDYYGAAMASAIVKDAFAYLDYPLTMAGLSPASNSGRSLSGGLEKHVQEFEQVSWPEVLPGAVRGRRISLMIMAQSLWLALQRSGKQSLQRHLDLPTFYALSIMDRPRQTRSAIAGLRRASALLGRNPARDVAALPCALASLLKLYASTDLVHALPMQVLRWRGFFFADAADVAQAVQVQQRHLRGVRLAFDAQLQSSSGLVDRSGEDVTQAEEGPGEVLAVLATVK